MAQIRYAFGVDFGTTNTVIAKAGSDGSLEAVTFHHGGVDHGTYPSALSFEQSEDRKGVEIHCEGGPWAIEQFTQFPHDIRYMQSFKSFIASRLFESTDIFRRRYSFADLLCSFFDCLRRNSGGQLEVPEARVVSGRPVAFFGATPDDALAMARYGEAYARAGFPPVQYVYEPVGAAFFYARQLQADATILVADFGGGTTDFSIIRFEQRRGALRATPLGHAGIAVAGDTFDYRIIDEVVSPQLGKDSAYRSFDQVLPVPRQYYSQFGRWHQLSLLNTPRTLRELARLRQAALAPELIENLIEIIENNWGLACYRAVSDAKSALSAQETAAFRFEKGDIRIRQEITRADFERWIGDDLDRIDGAVADLLVRSEIAAHGIDQVFMTGGSSFIPAVRARFADRFGAPKLMSSSQFQSVAFGLALIGLEDDSGAWSVAAAGG